MGYLNVHMVKKNCLGDLFSANGVRNMVTELPCFKTRQGTLLGVIVSKCTGKVSTE